MEEGTERHRSALGDGNAVMKNIWIRTLLPGMVLFAIFLLLALWLLLVRRGRQFALRDRLQKADAIAVLAGTRGNIAFLQGKIRTAVQLYQQGWAPYILCTGKFSVKVTETATLIPVEALHAAVAAGRIQEKDVAGASTKWDIGLGARFMAEQAMQLGVPAQALLIEEEELDEHLAGFADGLLRGAS